MAGTKEGSRKAVAKILSNDPDFYRKIGSIGGKKSGDGGFASKLIGSDGLSGRERARVAGRIGGRLSTRKGVVSKRSTD